MFFVLFFFYVNMTGVLE